MAFASDDFNRADGALGANWASFFGGITVVSNAAQGGSLVCAARWTATSFGADQTSSTTIVGFSSGTTYPGAAVRMDASGDCYYVAVDSSNAYIQRLSGGTDIPIATRTSGAWANGDVIGLDIVGTTLQVLKNGAAYGATASDATLASGQPGLYLYGSASVDNWTADDGAAVETSTIAWVAA